MFPTTAVSFTASMSMVYEARPLATQRSTAPPLPRTFTGIDLPSSIQEAFSLQNGSVFLIPVHLKHP
jgi:hypothetical protein